MSNVTSDNLGSPSDDCKDWRTGKRQPGVMKPTAEYLKFRLRIETVVRKGQNVRRMVFSTEAGYDTSWATEAAAIAAKPHFKRWVDDGMKAECHSQQRVGQAVSAAAQTESVARNQARIPIRFSGRNRLQCAPTVALSLQVDKSGVAAVTLDVTLPTEETLDIHRRQRWHQRSAQVVDCKKRRRDAAEAAAAAIPAACCGTTSMSAAVRQPNGCPLSLRRTTRNRCGELHVARHTRCALANAAAM